jgi:hypothetical protein
LTSLSDELINKQIEIGEKITMHASHNLFRSKSTSTASTIDSIISARILGA